MTAAYTIVQGTRRPFRVAITSPGADPDLTAVTSVTLYVHRHRAPADTTETWATAIEPGATPSALSVTYTPTADGEGSIAYFPEILWARPILSFASGPDVECTDFSVHVLER